MDSRSEYKIENIQRLCTAIYTGDQDAVLDMLEKEPATFFQPLSTPFTINTSRVFDQGTTPLQILFYIFEPMQNLVMPRLSEKGFKTAVDNHRKAFMFTGVMTATNGEAMCQERQYQLSKMITAFGKLNLDLIRDELSNAPGWVSQVICGRNFSIMENIELLSNGREKKPMIGEISWEDFLKEDPFCGLYWDGTHCQKVPTANGLEKGTDKDLFKTKFWLENLAAYSSALYEKFALETLKIRPIPDLTLPVIKSNISIPKEFYCELSGQFLRNPIEYWRKDGSERCEKDVPNLHSFLKYSYFSKRVPTELERQIDRFKALHPDLFYDPKTMRELPIPPIACDKVLDITTKGAEELKPEDFLKASSEDTLGVTAKVIEKLPPRKVRELLTGIIRIHTPQTPVQTTSASETRSKTTPNRRGP